MSTEAMSTFFAVLCLSCWLATIATIVLVIIARARPDSWSAVTVEGIADVALWLAWLVAAVTTAGSLYYSEIAHFVPCELCWYQRICAYPLAAILLVAAVTRDRRVWRYVLPLTVVGAAIATYHVQLQAYPDQRTFCSTLVPCTTRYVWEFGFVSLPFMALACFCFVTVMVLLARTAPADGEGDVAGGGHVGDDPGEPHDRSSRPDPDRVGAR